MQYAYNKRTHRWENITTRPYVSIRKETLEKLKNPKLRDKNFLKIFLKDTYKGLITQYTKFLYIDTEDIQIILDSPLMGKNIYLVCMYRYNTSSQLINIKSVSNPHLLETLKITTTPEDIVDFVESPLSFLFASEENIKFIVLNSRYKYLSNEQRLLYDIYGKYSLSNN